MNVDDPKQVRGALEIAMGDLLEGRVPGPLTGLRLVELAGVKRHRLTHDNADLNQQFQQRVREIHQSKPEIERLRKQLSEERERSRKILRERDELALRVQNYATALLIVSEERDRLRNRQEDLGNVKPLFGR